MRTTQLLYLLFFTAWCSAQVGIGTTNPQQSLHIAGADSTIRFDTFNTTNSPLDNNGVDLAPVFVHGKGDLVIGNGSGGNGNVPLNFLIVDTNFIPDDPYGVGYNTGKVVNNGIGENHVEEFYRTKTFVLPQSAMIEVKFGVTMMIQGSDISLGPPFSDVTYDASIKIGTFFCIDVDNDGLDASERAKIYGINGQYYETQYGGITGYSYLNCQGYLELPAGTHRIYFFGVITDDNANYTSVGYGGAMDYLKIRIYN